MLPSNRPWDTLCPRAHCRRRRNYNLLIRFTLLSATPCHNYGILSTTTGPDILTRFYVPANARDSSISKNHRNRLGYICGSFIAAILVISARIRGKTAIGLARRRSFDAGNDFRSKTEEQRGSSVFAWLRRRRVQSSGFRSIIPRQLIE